MIKSDSDYTYALGERAKMEKALAQELRIPTDMVYVSAIRVRLGDLDREIGAYERTLQKSVHQLSFSERIGQEGFQK